MALLAALLISHIVFYNKAATYVCKGKPSDYACVVH